MTHFRGLLKVVEFMWNRRIGLNFMGCRLKTELTWSSNYKTNSLLFRQLNDTESPNYSISLLVVSVSLFQIYM